MLKRSIALSAILLCAACTGKYVRETTAAPFDSNGPRAERGQYLVDQVTSCGACHSGRDDGNVLSGESTTQYLGGGYVLAEPTAELKLWMPNITSDDETGLGGWTDDEIARSIRDGVHKSGRFLFPMMPYASYQHMSDEDVESIVVYLRTVPKVKQEKPRVENEMPFMASFVIETLGMTMHEPAQNVMAPSREDPIKYGEYIMHLGHCSECHSMGETGPREPEDRFMAGADAPMTLPGLGSVWASNLTPDPETGLGNVSAEQLKQMIQSGTCKDGKKMAPPMSLFIPHISGMTDEDLDALVAYLKALPPIKNLVKERELTPEWKKALASAAPVKTKPAVDSGSTPGAAPEATPEAATGTTATP